MGDVATDNRYSVSLRADNQGANYSQSKTRNQFTLTSYAVQIMRDNGVFKLSDMTRNPNQTEFERIILRAVRWLASAQTQVETDNAFLNLVTSLETIFQVKP